MSVILCTGQISLPTSTSMWAQLFLQTWDEVQQKHDEEWHDIGLRLYDIVTWLKEHRETLPRLTLEDIPADAPGMLGLYREHLVREAERRTRANGQGEAGERGGEVRNSVRQGLRCLLPLAGTPRAHRRRPGPPSTLASRPVAARAGRARSPPASAPGG